MYCSHSETDPVIVFISKIVQIQKENINVKDLNANQKPNSLFGFARIFSGVLKQGQSLFLLSGKNQVSHSTEIKIDQLYLMMAQNL
jgi:translation elongation factor EF-G